MPQPIPITSDEQFFAVAREYAAWKYPHDGRVKRLTFHMAGGSANILKVPEAAHPPQPTLAHESPPSLPARRASPDFRSIHWDGHPYKFTELQAAVVKVLWEAWESGLPELAQETLRTAAHVDTDRLSELFRKNIAWGKVIFEGSTQGTLRLGHKSEDT